jgi:hypothetical protein
MSGVLDRIGGSGRCTSSNTSGVPVAAGRATGDTPSLRSFDASVLLTMRGRSV